MLTLASSAFAMPTSGVSRGAGAYAWTSALEVDSISQLGGADSASMADDAVDRDASVRALRPRSSRRGSWESEASRWSAAVSGTGTGTGTGGLSALGRGGSVRTAPSFRTGGQTVEDQDTFSLIDEDPNGDEVSTRGDDEVEGQGGAASPGVAERDRDETRSPISVNSESEHGRSPRPLDLDSPSSSPPGSESQTSSSGEEPTRPTTPNDRKTESAGHDTTPKKEKLNGFEHVGLGSPIQLEK